MSHSDFYPLFFTGCWTSVLHPDFDSSQLKKNPPDRFSATFWLALVGFIIVQYEYIRFACKQS